MSPRSRPSHRIDALVDAALNVFGRRGYRRTQMSDVAREMGVSAGSLYNYVASKEALFHLCVDRALAAGPAIPTELPVPDRPLVETLERLRERVNEVVVLPRLDQALQQEAPVDVVAELQGVVDELYRLMERTRRAQDAIERSAQDVPELAAFFYLEVRQGLIRKLTKYLQTRSEGGLLLEHGSIDVAARFVLETTVWFARHRLEDPEAAAFDEDLTRETVVQLVTNALVDSARVLDQQTEQNSKLKGIRRTS